MGVNEGTGNTWTRCLPGTIRELLKRLIERKAVIVLDARTPPEKVEIEAVVGNLLVAESCEGEHKIKFIDIDFIAEVKIEREELMESIFGPETTENDEYGDCGRHGKARLG